MVNFLLVSKEITKYSKKQIDNGFTPQKVYDLCSCIREAFCLSYSIRKENNLYIYFQKENLAISFIGKKLRYLGPDERSQAILLLKAINKGLSQKLNLDAEIKRSTPGIYYITFFDEFSFWNYFMENITGKFYLILDGKEISENDLVNHFLEGDIEISGENNLYIIPTYQISPQKSKLITRLQQMKKINFLSLTKIKSIENKILYLNFRKDHQEHLNE